MSGPSELALFFGRLHPLLVHLPIGLILLLAFLEVLAPEHKLYLAISSETYSEFFEQQAIRFVVQRCGLALLVVNVDAEEIVQWRS